MLRYGVLVLLILGVLPARTLFFVAEGDGKIQAAHPQPLQVYAEQAFSGIWVNETHVRDTVLHIVSSGDATVYRFRADSLTPLPSWVFPSGSNPYSLAFHPSGSALVTLYARDSVALVQDGVIQYFPTGRSPEGVSVWGDRFVVVVSGYDRNNFVADTGGVYIHDTAGAIVDSFPRLCVNPQTGVVEGDTLWLLCTGDYAGVGGKLLKILLLDGTRLDSVDLSAYYPTALWQDPVARVFYVSGYRASDWAGLILRLAGGNVQEVQGVAGFSGTPYRDSSGVVVFLEPNFTGSGRLVAYDPVGDTLVTETPVGTGAVGLSVFDGDVVNPDVGVAEVSPAGPVVLALNGRVLEVNQPGAWVLEVIDVMGRRIRTFRGHGETRKILDLPRGVYLFRLNGRSPIRAVVW